MQEIKLTQGKVALVDDCDFALVSQFKWIVQRVPSKSGLLWYAIRNLPRNGKKRRGTKMHRLILGSDSRVDHIDGDGLNNQRANLRACTPAQNQYNRRKSSGCSSRFKGVSRHALTGKWQAYISISGKRLHLGLFVSEKAAANAYDVAAMSLFGAFAKPNMMGVD